MHRGARVFYTPCDRRRLSARREPLSDVSTLFHPLHPLFLYFLRFPLAFSAIHFALAPHPLLLLICYYPTPHLRLLFLPFLSSLSLSLSFSLSLSLSLSHSLSLCFIVSAFFLPSSLVHWALYFTFYGRRWGLLDQKKWPEGCEIVLVLSVFLNAKWDINGRIFGSLDREEFLWNSYQWWKICLECKYGAFLDAIWFLYDSSLSPYESL